MKIAVTYDEAEISFSILERRSSSRSLKWETERF